MKKYNVYIQFEGNRHDDYILNCDADEEAINKAKDMIIEGFTFIEVNNPSYCYLNIEEDERTVYDGRLYPCADGVTEIEP